MAELLPEVQLFGEDGKASARKNTVVDILTRVQCFGTYVSVLGPCFQNASQSWWPTCRRLLRLANPIRVEHGFSMILHFADRLQSPAIGGGQKSMEHYTRPDPTGPRCELCMSVSHKTGECVLMEGGRKTGAGSLIRMHGGRGIRTTWQHLPPSGEVCRVWNQNRCRFLGCCHTHVCELCGGNHSATACQWAQGMHRPSPRSRVDG